MFGLFKKKNLTHEPLDKQIADIKRLNPLIANEILKGLDCDRLPNASGAFGSLTNPIPVNSPLGEIKYLGKLRGKTGYAVFFHRIGSTSSPATNKLIDIFELVCQDGTQWNKLYFDGYHPRRSNLIPNGYTLVPYNKDLKMDIPYAYGVTFLVVDFPYGIPNAIENDIGKSNAFSRHAREKIKKHNFERPNQNIVEKPLDNEIKQNTNIDENTYKEILVEFEENIIDSKSISSILTLLIYQNLRFEHIEFFDKNIFPKYPELIKHKASFIEEINAGVLACGLMAIRIHYNDEYLLKRVKEYIFKIESKRVTSKEKLEFIIAHIENYISLFDNGLYLRGLTSDNLESTLLDMAGFSFQYATNIKVMNDNNYLKNYIFHNQSQIRLKKPVEFEIQILSMYEAMLKNYLKELRDENEPQNHFAEHIINNFKIELSKMLEDDYNFKTKAEQSSIQFESTLINKNKFGQNKEIKTTDDIDNYSFITEILNKSIALEKDILTNHKDNLIGYTNTKLFDTKHHRRFLIERFIFLKAYLEWGNNELFNTNDMYIYVAAIATKVYNISHQQAYLFIDNRQKLYFTELKMLNELEHPHPGKIIWCLHNPTNIAINHELTSCFEMNIVAGLYFLNAIFDVYKSEIENFGNSRN